MSDILKYFNKVKAQRQLDSLAKKYKDKKIVIYGAGEYFRILNENFDLSKLNIVGIVDKKFENSKNTSFDYKPLSLKELDDFDFDIILVALYDGAEVCNDLENYFLFKTNLSDKLVLSIIEPTFSYVLKVFLKNYVKKEIVLKNFKKKYFSFKTLRYWNYYQNLLEKYVFIKDIIDFNHIKSVQKTKEECIEYLNRLEEFLQQERITLLSKNKTKRIFLLIKKLNEVLNVLSEVADVNYLKPTSFKTLRNYQMKFLEFCKKMTNIFEENGIQYFLMGGTLIGALRHNGFVPWDDDIDIGMMRADYERLKEYLKDNAIRVDVSNTYYSQKNAAIAINATLKKNPNKLVYIQGGKYIQIYQGKSIKDCSYIDIFPHDYYKDDYLMEEHNEYIKKINSEYIKKDNYQEVLEFLETEVKLNKNVVDKSNKIYFSIDCFVSFTMNHENFICEDTIFPLKKMKFENYEFCVPNKPEEYISVEYPSYREFPKNLEIAPDFKKHLKL